MTPSPTTATADSGAAARMARAANATGITPLPAQRRALAALGTLADDVLAGRAPATGLYLRGPVGAGKTWLADLFVAALGDGIARRVHAHALLLDLGAALFRHSVAGHADGPRRAVDDIVGDARVLVLDELHAEDAGDARLLTVLFARIAERRIPLVVTSNQRADELMADSPWRHTMLEGIALLTAGTRDVLVDDGRDHRVGATATAAGFRRGRWVHEEPRARSTSTVTSGSRTFEVVSTAGALTMTFAQLCEVETASMDYAEWITRFDHWGILDVPPMGHASPSARQRLLTAIDMLVDADVRTDIHSVLSRREFIDSAVAPVDGRAGLDRFVSRLNLLTEV